MRKDLDKTMDLLKKYDQEHLLHFYSFLSEEEKSELINEILSIDFDLVQDTYNGVKCDDSEKVDNEFKPLKAKSLKLYTEEERVNLYNIGMDALTKGRVAVYLVAGGQGTRLGHKGPKGTFSIGLPSGKSLFQLQCERLIYLSKECKKYIPLYIMTSVDNHQDTVSFFEEHNYFGYPKSMIMFFKQRTMPAVGEDGKILLSDKGRIVMSSNGNGGCFLALKESGALEDMKSKGVEWLFIYGIDNALVRVADPLFIGFTISSKQLAASKVVEKKYAEEKVGVLCYKNNKPAIVEYSEMQKVISSEVDSEGKLAYSNANILNHLLNIKFIEKIIEEPLPLHIAHKKIEHLDSHGRKVLPTEPNGYKFEYFLFDIFEKLEDMAALEVEREEEFAPVKNKEGEDSPETAKKLILNLHKKWLTDAGFNKEELEKNQIEVSPLTSYYGDNLKDKNINEI